MTNINGFRPNAYIIIQWCRRILSRMRARIATVLSIDNQGAVLMVDAQQPTRKTQHIDIKHLKIQEWVE